MKTELEEKYKQFTHILTNEELDKIVRDLKNKYTKKEMDEMLEKAKRVIEGIKKPKSDLFKKK